MDPYMKERWAQFHGDMAKEFSILSQMQQALQLFKRTPMDSEDNHAMPMASGSQSQRGGVP